MSYKNSISGQSFIQAHKAIAKDVGLVAAAVLGEMGFEESKYDSEEFFHSQEEFVNTLCISMRQFKDAVDVLKSKGYITVTRKGVPCKNYYKINEEPIRIALENYNPSQHTVSSPVSTQCANKPERSVPAINNNINNNKTKNISSDEDIDSNESIKEQETDSTELNKDVGMNSLMNNIGMTRASDMNNEFLTSWMEDEPKDISDRKDMSKSNKSPKGEERKSSAGKKERKAPNTPASRLYGFYRSLVERLVASGRIAPMQFAEGFKAVNAEYGKLKKTLLARMTEEDAAEYLEYVSHDDWILDNRGFPLDYILSERTIVNKYNRMMQERKKRQEEYIPPAVKISRAICSKCGNELFFDGTCSFCELENYKK